MFDVRPGVTGWAQVNGRKEVPWPERIQLNCEYVERISFTFDMKIFFMTIFKVLTNANNKNTTKLINRLVNRLMLKLMYITNHPEIAKIAENAGVDRIFIDLEQIGKAERQGGMDTVQSLHSLDDIKKVKSVLLKTELLVRSNPIHEGSKEEIDTIIENGANIVMLPFFKTVNEVAKFIDLVSGRAKVMLLVETAEAVEKLDAILELDGIDEIHIGLNDLHLAYHMKFMFELLANGTVEYLGKKILKKNTFWFWRNCQIR